MSETHPPSPTSGWSEGHDGDHPVYRERLRPPAAVIVIALGLAGIVGVAYGAAYGASWGWAIGLSLAVVVSGVLAATTVILRVDDRVVRAGRARLPLVAVSAVDELDRDEMVKARRHGDPRDFIVLRAWSSRLGIAITLDDPRDPHPRWIVSTRHPDRFSAAILEFRARTPQHPAGE